MAINRARQTGSAFTAWKFTGPANSSNFILCQEVSHRSPQPIAAAVEVHPLNYIRPTEIIVPRAISHGEITLTVMESFGKTVFEQLGISYGIKITDLGDLFNWLMTNPAAADTSGSKIELVRIVRDPVNNYYAKKFIGARIVDVRDDETTRVDSTVNPLQISVWYTKLQDAPELVEAAGNRASETNTDGTVKDAPWGL
jgi:hypothetical protein